MKIYKNKLLVPFLFALTYGVLFYLLQFSLAATGVFNVMPSAENLHSWDVGYYDSIAHQGYNYESDNTGFFILFPLLWKISHLGIWGISFLNIFLFALGFALLIKTLNEYSKTFWLLCLSIPSVYFVFIPYTEALFFLLGTVALYAIKEKKLWLIWLSLFLISLVRATAVFFLPALLLTELLSNPWRDWHKSCLRFLYKYALPSLLGLGVFILWQYHETGIWFAYFKTQSIHWQHAFTLPGMPFSNIGDAIIRYHWLNAFAIFIDAVAIFILIKQFLFWIKNKPVLEPSLLFSLGYLAMTVVFIITFNPKNGGDSTNIMGAHRYTFITPFCFYFIHHLFQRKFENKDIIKIIVVAALFWQLFHSYTSWFLFLRIGFIPTLMLIAFTLYTKTKSKLLLIAIIGFNFLFQLYFFQQFITPLYVD